MILCQNTTFDHMIISQRLIQFCLAIVLLFSCKSKENKEDDSVKISSEVSGIEVNYAKSFSIANHDDYSIIYVHKPWPSATKTYRYLVIDKENLATITFPKDTYDAVITTPISSIVATSTTHIPALESLGVLKALVGFPDTQYISSMPAREQIAKGEIRELGSNERLNTEMVISLNPDLIVGFAIDENNAPYEVLKKAKIPVIYNGDWTEESPLGKAEWIKFFGVLFNKERKADSIFREIEQSYHSIQELALQSNNLPTVLSGALYKDVWYAPAGKSWAAQFIRDANAKYIYESSDGTGSLSLGIESVLEKAQESDYWVAPAQFTTYDEMERTNEHYLQFKPFQKKKVFTFAATKGATGGLLYYELAPQRPDLVLKDLVHIFHPELLPNHTPYFFTPLK